MFPIRCIAVLGSDGPNWKNLEIQADAFQSAISRYSVSNAGTTIQLSVAESVFQSAISRYSVSNVINELAQMREDVRFNPLYRGTRFPTLCTLFILLLERRCFNPLYRGTRFPTWRHMPPKRMEIYRFQSAISRYSVSNEKPMNFEKWLAALFQSAISRYSVSNRAIEIARFANEPGFNPLCRGTWFPTSRFYPERSRLWRFNPLCRGTWFPTLPQKHPL